MTTSAANQIESIATWLAACKDLPRGECEILLEEILKVNRAYLLAHPERTLSADEQKTLANQLHALRGGMPLAYIIGQREFWGITLNVTNDVLIPRPDTELLVELVLAKAPPNAQVLDLGTGSGAIAIALKHERSDLAVTATDNSPAALNIAQDNATQNQVDVQFLQSDWFAHSGTAGPWDVILSNPPYIAANDPHLVQLSHEPNTALVSAQEGFADLEQIIRQAPSHLKPNGQLFVEHGYNQAKSVRQLFLSQQFEAIQSHLDLGKIERVTSGTHCRQDNTQHEFPT